MTWRGRDPLVGREGVGTSIQPDRTTPAHLFHPQNATSQGYRMTLPGPWATPADTANDTVTASRQSPIAPGAPVRGPLTTSMPAHKGISHAHTLSKIRHQAIT